MTEMRSAMDKRNRDARVGMVRNAAATYKSELARISDVQLDVVTIRNRLGPFHGQVTLFSAIRELERHGFRYAEVHCNFCRGAQDGHKMANNTSP